MERILPFSAGQLKHWTESIPTPFYIYDESGIRNTVKELYHAFEPIPDYREHFAVKALPNPSVLRLLKETGCGVDCASIPELHLAEACGFHGEEIIFTSNQTTAPEYQAARSAGAVINLDDLSQVEHLEAACGIPETVCCRYNPGRFSVKGLFIGDLPESKFGMTEEQVIEAFEKLRNKGVKNFGIHAMLAGCTLDESYYPTLAAELTRLVLRVRETLGIQVSFLDFAGGIGIPYRPDEEPVDIAKAVRGIREAFDKAGIMPAVRTEMGRFITGPHGYLITRVVGKKYTYKTYVGVDASPANLIRPAMYGSYHHISVCGKPDDVTCEMVDVVGPLCENNDKFAVDRFLPMTGIGDILIIHDAGAHGHSMGYNYNGRLRSAEYMLSPDGSLKMIRRAETEQDYFATLYIDPEFKP